MQSCTAAPRSGPGRDRRRHPRMSRPAPTCRWSQRSTGTCDERGEQEGRPVRARRRPCSVGSPAARPAITTVSTPRRRSARRWPARWRSPRPGRRPGIHDAGSGHADAGLLEGRTMVLRFGPGSRAAPKTPTVPCRAALPVVGGHDGGRDFVVGIHDPRAAASAQAVAASSHATTAVRGWQTGQVTASARKKPVMRKTSRPGQLQHARLGRAVTVGPIGAHRA